MSIRFTAGPLLLFLTRAVAPLLGASTIAAFEATASAVSVQEWCAPSPYECAAPEHVAGGEDYMEDALDDVWGSTDQCDSITDQALTDYYRRLNETRHQNDTIDILSAAVRRVASESEAFIIALAAVPDLRLQSIAVAERTGFARCSDDCVAEGYLMLTLRYIQVTGDSAVVHLNTKRLYPRALRGVLFRAMDLQLQRNTTAEFGWRVISMQVSEG